MTKVHCSVPERCVNPLFEVFDGGDFVLSSYHDIESDETEMRIYLEDAAQAPDAARRLADALRVAGCAAEVSTSEVPDEDWKLSYRRHFRTEKIARRLVTVPTWELDDFKASADPDMRARIPLVLDPGLAFGTGKHETTRACLEYIDEIAGAKLKVESEKFKVREQKASGTFHFPLSTLHSFLDMGCGSGILSIAAAKLGFGDVEGFDVDPCAVAAAEENAERNGVGVPYRRFALGRRNPEKPARKYDLVVANILGPLLVRFADEICAYVGGRLVISGILDTVYPEVLAVYVARGFSEISRKTAGEWTTGLLAPAC